MPVCGLLGERLGHSYSPRLHGLLASYEYRLYERKPEEVAEFLQEGEFHGINVTIPYKKTVIPYCDTLSEAAQAIGSVNTILRRADGSLYGDNTDAAGFAAMLEESGLDLNGKKALVLGSGGASLTVCHVLRARGIGELFVISRRGEDNYDNLDKHADAAIIVNTTPVGMYPNNGERPLDLTVFPKCEAVFDLIYNPLRTALMLQAETLWIPAYGGLRMLVYQAKAAAERFTGERISEEKALCALHSLQTGVQNILLVGMPGSGKSMVGRQLATLLDRAFVDADAEVEAQASCSIPELFAQEGEAGFRQRETAVLRSLCARSGLVIATGGGCVTREENFAILRQNGFVVYLKREISDLAREGRPLSIGADLNELFATRRASYERFADVEIENNAPPEDVAQAIKEAVYEGLGA